MKHVIILCVIGLFFLVLGNNLLSLTNPDEVFYSLSAKEMAQQHTWLVPYIFGHPQFEKPILTFWLLRVSFLAFGVNSFAARLPPAVFGLLGVLSIYFFCLTAYKDKNVSLLSAFILMSSGLYMALSRFVMTDMVFSVLILMSLTAFYTGYVRRERRGAGLLLFFAFSGLAVLTKGLLGIAFPLATVLLFLALRRDNAFLANRHTLYGACIFAILTVPWFTFMISRYGHGYIHEFFYNDHIRRILEAEHPGNDTWYFYPMTMALGMLPWSIPLLAGFVWLIRKNPLDRAVPHNAFLLSWVVSTFVILQIAHSKLTSYILPAMPALAVITGAYLHDLLVREKRKALYVIIGLSSTLILGLSTALVLVSTGLVTLDFQYYQYLPDWRIAAAFCILSLAVVGGCVVLAYRKRLRWSVYVLGLQLPVLLMFGLFSHNVFEDYVSSERVSAYLMEQPDVGDTILCSKMLARGVRYYTNKDIAVVGGNFFSPHPIPILNTDTDIREFLSRRKTIYAVVQAAQLRQLKQVAEHTFELTERLHLGDAYVVKIGPCTGDCAVKETDRFDAGLCGLATIARSGR